MTRFSMCLLTAAAIVTIGVIFAVAVTSKLIACDPKGENVMTIMITDGEDCAMYAVDIQHICQVSCE